MSDRPPYRLVTNEDGVTLALSTYWIEPGHCLGTRAQVPAWFVGQKVRCPICGRLSSVNNSRRRVWAHHVNARTPQGM